MTLAEINARLAVIGESLETFDELKLLMAEQKRLETAIATEQLHPDVKRLLDWVDEDPSFLLRKARRALRGP